MFNVGDLITHKNTKEKLVIISMPVANATIKADEAADMKKLRKIYPLVLPFDEYEEIKNKKGDFFQSNRILAISSFRGYQKIN